MCIDHESDSHTESTENALVPSEKPHVTDLINHEEDAEKVSSGSGPACEDPNC